MGCGGGSEAEAEEAVRQAEEAKRQAEEAKSKADEAKQAEAERVAKIPPVRLNVQHDGQQPTLLHLSCCRDEPC